MSALTLAERLEFLDPDRERVVVRIRFSPPGATTTVSRVVGLNPGEETALLHA